MPTDRSRPIMQPTRRSRLRLRLGGVWFTWKRRLAWYCSATRYAAARSSAPLGYPVFSHSSPLLRSLPKLELRLQENKRL